MTPISRFARRVPAGQSPDSNTTSLASFDIFEHTDAAAFFDFIFATNSFRLFSRLLVTVKACHQQGIYYNAQFASYYSAFMARRVMNSQMPAAAKKRHAFASRHVITGFRPRVIIYQPERDARGRHDAAAILHAASRPAVYRSPRKPTLLRTHRAPALSRA